MNEPKLFQFNQYGYLNTGYISIAEIDAEVPFPIKRVYWTYYTPNHVIRGGHAHKVLQQIIVAVSGIIEIELEGKKNKKHQFKLDKPSIGVYIPSGYWRDIRFSHNAVMLCLASEIYDESDYIRNYESFLEWRNQ